MSISNKLSKLEPSKLVTYAYNQIAEEYARRWFDITPEDKPHVDRFLKLLPSGGYILDVGCGVGGWVKYFMKNGFRTTGIDISEGMLEVARRRVPTGDFRLMDLMNLGFKENMFDAIVAAHIFIHIPDSSFDVAFQELNKILKPSGKLLLMGMKNHNETVVDEPLKEGVKQFLSRFTLSDLVNALTSSEFEVLENNEVKVIGLDGSVDAGIVIIAEKYT